MLIQPNILLKERCRIERGYSEILAWEIRWTEEPSRQEPMGWQRVGHDWAPENDLPARATWPRGQAGTHWWSSV